MSIADKITRLQTAKTAIGTAITAKGGTVAAGDGFEDFAADVGTIPSGGNNWYDLWKDYFVIGSNHIKNWNEGGTNLPETFEYRSNMVSNNWILPSFYCNNTGTRHNGLKHIIFDVQTTNGYINGADSFECCGDLESIVTNVPIRIEWGLPSFWKCSVKEIRGGFFSSRTDQTFYYDGATQLETLEMPINRLTANLIFTNNASLNDFSLLQIGNCLSETVPKTLTMMNELKARVEAMLGTVAMDSTNTYHIFTADPSGTVTLSEFITTVKGWTLA